MDEMEEIMEIRNDAFYTSQSELAVNNCQFVFQIFI